MTAPANHWVDSEGDAWEFRRAPDTGWLEWRLAILDGRPVGGRNWSPIRACSVGSPLHVALEDWARASAETRVAQLEVELGVELAANEASRKGDVILHRLLDEARAQLLNVTQLHPRDDWTESDGPVLWWIVPIAEPPYAGTPLEDDFPDDYTHWSRIPEVAP